MNRIFAWVAPTLVLALPSIARACPVCFSTENDAYRFAYLVTGIFMTLLPFGVVGGLVLWVWRRAEAAEIALRRRYPEPAEDSLHG